MTDRLSQIKARLDAGDYALFEKTLMLEDVRWLLDELEVAKKSHDEALESTRKILAELERVKAERGEWRDAADSARLLALGYLTEAGDA